MKAASGNRRIFAAMPNDESGFRRHVLRGSVISDLSSHRPKDWRASDA